MKSVCVTYMLHRCRFHSLDFSPGIKYSINVCFFGVSTKGKEMGRVPDNKLNVCFIKSIFKSQKLRNAHSVQNLIPV